jgi:hypothetical protein
MGISLLFFSTLVQRPARILSDDYWAVIGRKVDKAKSADVLSDRERREEEKVPTSNALLYRKHSPLVGQGKRS